MSEEPAATDVELARLASVNLNLLVPLLAVLEQRSVTRAATRVGLSQPAMSHALRRLRRLLGDELIVRHGNSMVLTPRAAELLAPLRRALRQTARVVDFPAFDPAVDSRVITVAMTTSTATVIGAALARLVGERAPHVALRLLTERIVSDSLFTDEGVDVLLLSFASRYPRERLYDDRWVVIAGPGAPEGASALDLLTTLPHVVYDGAVQYAPYSVLDDHGIAYRVRDRVSDYQVIPHLVAGSGAVAVHRYRPTHALQAPLGLRIEEFPFPLPDLGIDIVWNPWLVDAGFTTWLRGILAEAAAGLDPRPR